MSKSVSVSAILSGWGRYPRAKGNLVRPENISQLERTLSELEPNAHLLGRGLGKSYGDASFSSSGYNVLTARLNKLISFDEKTGTVTCEAGVTFEDLINAFLPRGWFPPVTPGTKFVTVGGAFACDVHGKNHHRDGSFSRFVDSVKIRLASGETVVASPTENSDLFQATVGGMGLTGLILQVSLKLLPVETSFIRTRRVRCGNLAETIAWMNKTEADHQYSVCWIDCLARGANLGRGVLILGDHAKLADLPDAAQKYKFLGSRGPLLSIPMEMPEWLLNPLSVGLFNAGYFGINGPRESGLAAFDPFFYPLDAIDSWNRLYGKRGFVQYQCVVPYEGGVESLQRVLSFTSSRGLGSFLAVLKRLRSETAPLAFPMDGYTLTLDLPVTKPTLVALAELDKIVAELGGRVYLAKDAVLSPQMFRAMYKRFPEWLELKRRFDPTNKFSSALSERLRLFED